MFLESNWTWLAERWGNMADLAERVDDLICSFDSAGDTTMDTLSMLIFGWMLFGLVVLCVGKYVYNRFVLNEAASATVFAAKDGYAVHGDNVGVGGGGGGGGSSIGTGGKSVSLSKQKVPTSVSGTLPAGKSSVTSSGGSGSGGGGGGGGTGSGSASGPGPATPGTTPVIGTSPSAYVPPTPPVRKRLTARKTSGALISPARSSRSLHLPTATGADADAVRWVNEIIVWLYSDPAILDQVLTVWVASLNQFTTNSGDEVSQCTRFCQVRRCASIST